jgi:hypothetical protein
LGIIPLEVYLTKGFEKDPFLTAVYPYSALAKKIHLLAYDLFHAEDPEFLPKGFRRINWLERLITRFSLVRIPAILNVNMIMAVVTIVLVITVLASKAYEARRDSLGENYTAVVVAQRILNHERPLPSRCKDSDPFSKQVSCVNTCYGPGNSFDDSCKEFWKSTYLNQVEDIKQEYIDPTSVPNQRPEVAPLIAKTQASLKSFNRVRVLELFSSSSSTILGILATWFLEALLINWSGLLDRSFTYQVRKKHWLQALGIYVVAVGMWCLFALYYEIFREASDINKVLLYIGLCPPFLAGINQVYKAVQELIEEGRWGEASFRICFVAFLIAEPIVMFKRWLL